MSQAAKSLNSKPDRVSWISLTRSVTRCINNSNSRVRLSELEEAFDADEAERQKRAEEKQRLEEEEAERQAAAQRSLVAATLLQCNYRMHLARGQQPLRRFQRCLCWFRRLA